MLEDMFTYTDDLMENPYSVQSIAIRKRDTMAIHAMREELMARKPMQIAITWNVKDVLEVRPDLTDEQALEVLLMAKDKHDAEIGINWDVLKIWADKLFPERTENATAAVMVFVSDGYARDAQFYCGTPTDNGCIHDDEGNWRDFRGPLYLETVRGTDDIDAAIRITADKYECSPDVLWGQIVF